MFPLKQTDRLFYLETPLGPDKLLVRSATIQEGISQPFRVHMELVSDDFNIHFDQILKKNVTLSIRQADTRTFGISTGTSRSSSSPAAAAALPRTKRYGALVLVARSDPATA